MGEDVFGWGKEIVERQIGTYHCKMYSPRRKHVAEMLQDAGKWQDREYLVQGARRITFAQHEVYVDRVVSVLTERGIQAGDKVMLLAANSVEWVVAFWAIMKIGGVVVSANGWWSEREVLHALSVAEPKLVIADDRQAQKLPRGAFCVLISEIEQWSQRDHGDAIPERPSQNEDAPAIILFTSGTTGAPKGAVLSHRSQVANQHNLLISTGRLPQDLTPQSESSTTLLAAPLFHIAGIQLLMTYALIGGRIVMTEGRFDASQVLSLIEEEKIDRWGATPTMLIRVLDSPDLAKTDTSSLKFVSTGGTFISPGIIERVRNAFPSIQDNATVVYGLSEAGGTLCVFGGSEYVRRPTAAGRPFATVDIRIDNPDESGIGEIFVRSATTMSGYLGKPDDATVDAQGWIHTGDLGRLDGDGYLHVTGRKKEIIIRGGENISAAHIENCLLEMPEIREVAAVGLPHPEWGEEVGVALVFKDGKSLPVDVLDRYCKTALAHFEVPSRWWVRTEPLPTTDNGKLAKHILTKEWPAD